jgi:hypothetical protein
MFVNYGLVDYGLWSMVYYIYLMAFINQFGITLINGAELIWVI